ncbi:MAG TPA: ThuA domain-containing protein [Candidatus Saccharimonadales bacterium]|nr:ThuA domain-containing protein [Candidatus Saccharimonadales bacterium]
MKRRFFIYCALLIFGVLPSMMGADTRPHIVFMVGESEYNTKTTLPAFAKKELPGIHCTFAITPSDTSNEFPGLEALRDADLLFISVRRRTPSKENMALIRKHIADGKPVVGIRTASHAFALRGKDVTVPEGHADWPTFDQDVLGGNYHDHYGKGIKTFAKVVPASAKHPVLVGIPTTEFEVPSHLYKNPDLPSDLTILLTARMEGRPEVEPIAWVNTAQNRRVFYTSLGSPEDFELPEFRRLLRNGIYWALKKEPTAAK